MTSRTMLPLPSADFRSGPAYQVLTACAKIDIDAGMRLAAVDNLLRQIDAPYRPEGAALYVVWAEIWSLLREVSSVAAVLDAAEAVALCAAAPPGGWMTGRAQALTRRSSPP
jgi:hypothetical protein